MTVNFPKINAIRAFAVLCVAVTSAYVMIMGKMTLDVLSGPDWCSRALGAGKAATANTGIPAESLNSCISLLTIQLKSVAINSFIYGGVVALCLATLVVIVLAGGKLDLGVTPTSVNVKMGKEKLDVDDVPIAGGPVIGS